MKTKLNPLALGLAGAIISVAVMLLLGIIGNFGLYEGALKKAIKSIEEGELKAKLAKDEMITANSSGAKISVVQIQMITPSGIQDQILPRFLLIKIFNPRCLVNSQPMEFNVSLHFNF